MILDQLIWERDRFLPIDRGKPLFNQAGEKDRLELQPLRLVQGQDLDRVSRFLTLRDWGVLPRLDQHREIWDEAGHAVLRRYLAEPLHEAEERGQVPHPLMIARRGRTNQPLAIAGALHEKLVEDPSGRLQGRLPEIALEIRQEGGGGGDPLRRDRRELWDAAGPFRHIEQDFVEAPVLPRRIGVTEDEIGPRHPVDLGAGQMKEAQGVLWVSQQPEERDNQPYLL